MKRLFDSPPASMPEPPRVTASSKRRRLLRAVRQLCASAAASPWLIGFLILALSASVRVGDLDAMVNVDMYIFWNRRIANFIAAVDSGEYRQTLQSHHPGVTFMWAAGLLWKSFGLAEARLDPVKLRLAVWPVASGRTYVTIYPGPRY
ncbi:MAG TPA: hypothetical protein VKP30_08760 [Polyangiaceae bacterium]|nr:hypothetical protein [Polyangiaceae bacterium]